MKRIGPGLLLCSMFALAAAGCGRSPRTTFYTLSPAVPEVTRNEPAAASGIAVVSVTLPELVDRPQLVLPESGSKVLILETHRWAEPLKTAVPRVLAENLARLTGALQVSSWPQHAAHTAGYRLFIDLQRFEVSGSRVIVDALWQLRGAGGEVLQNGRATVAEPLESSGHEAVVDGYSRALAAFARELAPSLRHLRPRE